jgi:N-acetylglucosamine-6-sulfatase
LFGKYLNHYNVGSYVPPGWSTWRALVGANSMYYDYDLSLNGTMQHFASAPEDYATDVYARMAANFIRTTPTGKPLFLYFAPPAPHGPTTPPRRYANALPTVRLPRYPDFNEADVSDKPTWVRRQDPLSSAAIDGMRARWLHAAQTLLAVDDAVATITKALAETGRLHDTLIVFTSDNGLSYGEHRLMGKLNPYEESIRVPMVVRWDGHVPAGSVSMHLAANVDLAPTFAAVAGATHPSLEGVSLVPLLHHDRLVHRALLVEHQFGGYKQDPPTDCQIRTGRWTLITYASGAPELYDLRADPYELRNVVAAPSLATTRHRLMGRVRVLCDPRPPGMPRF